MVAHRKILRSRPAWDKEQDSISKNKQATNLAEKIMKYTFIVVKNLIWNDILCLHLFQQRKKLDDLGKSLGFLLKISFYVSTHKYK